ncbi:hypothetical protein Vqi01_53010 [Micromonospora qiuiae]|uniref:Uncharacterized protein n=1 Tax=Micromonospora qiuiae TaxID=502268 RepID=A0ABQ4JHP1_9ACTN|nr:hypothetical protein [Micromonospora qiuiae]GIJ30139.1 hypothetical protein Vqi01_53010 [Micromonospora qiuiae]
MHGGQQLKAVGGFEPVDEPGKLFQGVGRRRALSRPPRCDRFGGVGGEPDRLELLDPCGAVTKAGEVVPFQPVEDVVEVLGVRTVSAADELQT